METSWSLTVGGVDVSSYVLGGAHFVESASSIDGIGIFTLNGSHSSAVQGADVSLSLGGTLLWEGYISSAATQANSSGTVTATMVSALPLASKLDVSTDLIISATDIGTVASILCAEANIPYGSQQSLGSTSGTLSITNVASGLSALATIAGAHWCIRNGSVEFIGPSQGMAPTDSNFNGTQVLVSAVQVIGGMSVTTRQPLYAQFSTQTTSGAIVQATIPEVSDADTLASAGSALAEKYGPPAINATTQIPLGVRAGDWYVDPSGVTAHAQRVLHTLSGGDFIATVDFGPAQLAEAQNSVGTAQSRLGSDFVAQGGVLTMVGWGGSRWGLSRWGM